MTHLDTARGSFHLLRQKPWSNSWPKVQKSGHVLIGKWAWESGAILFLKDKKAPDDRSFFPPLRRLPNSREKESTRKLFEGRRKNLSQKLSIFAKMTMYSSAVNTNFWAWSNFNSFAKFVSLRWWGMGALSKAREPFNQPDRSATHQVATIAF